MLRICITFVIMEINARIRMIIESHRLTAGAFADKIGVQRSNVSHVLSGRNKPSFEFLEKVLLAFPKVSALWLVTGRQEREKDNIATVFSDENPVQYNVKPAVEPKSESVNGTRKLVKTILLYDDATCEEYVVNPQ